MVVWNSFMAARDIVLTAAAASRFMIISVSSSLAADHCMERGCEPKSREGVIRGEGHR